MSNLTLFIYFLIFSHFLTPPSQPLHCVFMNRPFQRSSEYSRLTNADRASDGNRSTCSLTLIHSNSWWRIDLQGVHNISCVSIYNRNCSSLNLKAAEIYVGNSPKDNEFNAGQINVFKFPKSVFGRYVMVVRPGQKATVLCDVNITGTALGTLTLKYGVTHYLIATLLMNRFLKI
uniref:Fucolectin tachylectin-4 pentraxin-1 domain-containing protein n=1 Tax=Xiphophorus couchianus TaxID=32473 RepID=A0A3B5MSV0_9TELE